jgi:ATP-dependent Clp protease ATP-binding subunit ClpA
MFENFSEKAVLSVAEAHRIARELGHDAVDVEHLIFGLGTIESATGSCLANARMSPERIRDVLIDKLGKNPSHSRLDLPFTVRLKTLFVNSQAKRLEGNGKFLTCAQILLTALDSIQSLLTMLDVDENALRTALGTISQSDQDPETISKRSLTREQYVEQAVEFARKNPDWKAILVARLASYGIGLEEVEQRL